MHDYIFFSGQIIFDQFDQLQLVVQMDPCFQSLLVFQGKIGSLIGEYPDGFCLAIFPKGHETILHPQQESHDQQLAHNTFCFYIYHLFGSSISVNLIFINKIGLSFSFGVCYNHTRSVMPLAQKFEFFTIPALGADVMEVYKNG